MITFNRKIALATLLSLSIFPGGRAIAADVVEYIHTDALGSPVAVTNAAGSIVERTVYQPYGEMVNRLMSDGPGFTGHVSDAATGLTYMQQRYYDPTLGRFISADPVATDGNTGAAFNRYEYAVNNPYGFSDPDGREPTNEALYGPGGRTGGGISATEEIKDSLANDGTRKFAKGSERDRVNAVLYVVNKVREKVESVGNNSTDSAARYFMKVFQPVSTRFGVELTANIVKEISGADIKGLWYLRNIGVGTRFYRDSGIGFMAPTTGAIPGGFNIHTHPLEDNGRGWNSPFSTDDIETYRWQRSTGYVSTPSMKLFKTEAGGPIEEVE